MNVWIDILHTPQFNFYFQFIKKLNQEGKHNIYVTVLNRGKLPTIAKKELKDFSCVQISVLGRHRMSKMSAIIEANLLRLPVVFFWTLFKKIDISFSNGCHNAIIGRILRFPSYTFEDDIQTADYKLMSFFSTQNHSLLGVQNNEIKLHRRDKFLPVLKEWAYLAPEYFMPDVSVLEEYAVKPKEYLFLREVSVGTLNYTGQAYGAILNIKDLIPQDKKVLFSLEDKSKRNLYPSNWILLQEPIKDIHSLIYYSAGLISSGDSMAREAALLGVPAYYLGIRYDMPANAAAHEVAGLQNTKTMTIENWLSFIYRKDERQLLSRDRITNCFIDINGYLLSLIN